jgi:hypothetical protein
MLFAMGRISSLKSLGNCRNGTAGRRAGRGGTSKLTFRPPVAGRPGVPAEAISGEAIRRFWAAMEC